MKKKLVKFINRIKINSKIVNVLYFIIVSLTIVIGFLIYNNAKNHIKNVPSKNNFIDFNIGWHDKNNNPIILNSFKKNKNFKANKEYTFYHDADSSIQIGDTLCFRALSTDITVCIGNKKVLSTEYDKYLLSCKSPGGLWFFYNFTKDDLNQPIKLKIKTIYDDNSCYIDSMYIGSKSNYIISYINNNLLSFILNILTIFSGLAFILLDIYINYIQRLKKHTLFHIGLFAILVSIWTLIATHIFDFIPTARQTSQFISITLLYLIPISVMMFIRDYFKLNNNKIIPLNIAFNLFIYFIAWILHLFGYKDFHETLFLSHLTIFITCTIAACLFIYNKMNNKSLINKPTHKNFLSITNVIFIVIILCFLADIVIFYSDLNTNTGMFTQFASLLIILYLGILSFQNIYNLDKQITHNKFVQELAYSDGLTGLGNRTAFTEKISELENNIANYKTLGIVTFDINNLKLTNDTYGHSIGDDLIISASTLIKNTFSESCYSYRIGGDEFVVIIDSPDAEKLYKEYSMQFNVNIQNFNNFYNKPYKLSIAYACAFYKKHQNITLHEIINMSDKEMYNHKIKIKANKI